MNWIEPQWAAPKSVWAAVFCRGFGEPAERYRRDGELAGWRPGGALHFPQLRQVHGVGVVEVVPGMKEQVADACFSRLAGCVCVVRTADCLPVLICNRAGTEVAAVHAGWRGLAAGVVEGAIGRLRSEPGELLAWLGPAISRAHFEVGPEVRDVFLRNAHPDDARTTEACFHPAGTDRSMADLYALARLRLARTGIAEISGGGFCTYADADRFHSHRRDGPGAGRMHTMIAIKPSTRA